MYFRKKNPHYTICDIIRYCFQESLKAINQYSFLCLLPEMCITVLHYVSLLIHHDHDS